MADINLIVLPPSFPVGTCFSDIQTLANQIAAGLRVLFPGDLALFVASSNEPGLENRNRTWIKLDSATNVILGVFRWSAVNGKWLAFYPVPANSPERRMWVGSLASLDTYDGGSAGTVSDITGPFWQTDSAFADHWPLGVGATIATVGSDALVFEPGTPAGPKGIGVYVIKRTARIYITGN